MPPRPFRAIISVSQLLLLPVLIEKYPQFEFAVFFLQTLMLEGSAAWRKPLNSTTSTMLVEYKYYY